MPTGYTHDVQTGKVTDFQAFALQCARAFGALILMRDEPSDAPIPEAFKPSTFHLESLAKDRAELVRLRAMTPQEAGAASRTAYQAALDDWQERKARRVVERQRYTDMLAKVEAWEPPSVEHREFKKFMAQQLTSSIDFDCSDKYDDPPKFQSGEEWREERIRLTERSIEYDLEHQRQEVERTEGRNRWIKQLRDSLANQQQPTTR